MTAKNQSPDATGFSLDGRGPVYRQIRRAIATPILAGRLAPGARLPSEHAFMDLFGASRMTVNRALQMLADEGLVVRRRRHGTFVAQQVSEHAVMELRDIADEIEATGAAYGYELIERRVDKPDAALAGIFANGSAKSVLRLTCRHSSDGEPVLMEERAINLTTVPAARKETFEREPPNRWLLKNIPWSRVEHVIAAVNASENVAKQLGISAGEACLQVERTTWMGDDALTQVRLTYPGERHRLVGRFSTGQ